MITRPKLALFSEVNSKLGSPFIRILSGHPTINLVAAVTSPPDVQCSYFADDEVKVDLVTEANALGVPVLRPETPNAPDVLQYLRTLDLDYIIVANYQRKLGRDLLSIPRVAPLNFHPSPLPKYAGLAPFYWIARNGDVSTSISVIRMDEGLDTGPIVMQRDIQLSGRETGLELRTIQENNNVLMLLDMIPIIASRAFLYKDQDLAERTYFGKPTERDYRIDFSLPASVIERHVRAAYRHPGAHFYLEDRKITILSAHAHDHVDGPSIRCRPGELQQSGDGVFLRADDAWLRIVTVDVEGKELPARPGCDPFPPIEHDVVALPAPKDFRHSPNAAVSLAVLGEI